MKTKIIEVNLGIGMNQIFPEPIKIVIEDSIDEIGENEELSTTEDNESDKFKNLNS